MTSSTRAAAFCGLAAALAVLAPAGPAAAQSDNPFITRDRPRNLTLTIGVRIAAFQERPRRDRLPEIDVWEFSEASVIFPVVRESSSHFTHIGQISSRIRFNDREQEQQPALSQGYNALLEGYPAGTRLARWTLLDKRGREMDLNLTLPVTCWSTTLDEQAAARVRWPEGNYPPEAASTFEPEMFINFGPDGQPYENADAVAELVRRWTGGNPRQVVPLVTAKVLAVETMRFVRPSGDGLNFNRAGELEGIQLKGAPNVAAEPRRQTTDWDMVTLLVAVYRAAGLPARAVIGFDRGEDDGRFLGGRGRRNALRAWVEFYLYDETNRRGGWIPVDIVNMRASAGRIRGNYWEDAVPYFGTVRELQSVIPFAFQFHPPTDVRAYGSPGFWGWFVTPEPPEFAQQGLRFNAITTPRRPGDPPPGEIPDRDR
jgi:hypothetical protein